MHNIYTSTYFPFFILHSVLFSKEPTMKDDVFKCVTIFHYSSHQHQTGEKIEYLSKLRENQNFVLPRNYGQFPPKKNLCYRDRYFSVTKNSDSVSQKCNDVDCKFVHHSPVMWSLGSIDGGYFSPRYKNVRRR